MSLYELVNHRGGGGGSSVSGSAVTGLTPDQVLFGDSAGLIGQHTNLKFFPATGNMTIGGSADPGSKKLAVSGSVGVTGNVVAETGVFFNLPNSTGFFNSGGIVGTVLGNNKIGITANEFKLFDIPLMGSNSAGGSLALHGSFDATKGPVQIQPTSGNVVIGGTADPGSKKLAVSGSVGVEGSVEFVQSSGDANPVTRPAEFTCKNNAANSSALFFLHGANKAGMVGGTSTDTLKLWGSSQIHLVVGANIARAKVDAAGNFVVGSGSLYVGNEPGNHLCIPAASGAFTGTPTTIGNVASIGYDATNSRIYVHTGNGVWKSVAVA